MRFELARALLCRRRVLLLDEPLANLDINAQQTLLTDLQSLARSPWQAMALVLSSQQLYEVDRKSTRLNSSHSQISYAVFCLKKKKSARHVPPANPQFSWVTPAT